MNPWPAFDLLPKELAALARMAPVYELVSVLAYDDGFVAAVDQVREGADLDAIARRYVRREGRTLRVMLHVLAHSAASRSAFPAQPVLELGVVSVVVDAPLTPDDPADWPHAKRRVEAARMLARLGSGGCIECGARLASDGRPRRYCGPHEPRGPYAEKNERYDREAITNLLNAVGDALGIE